MLQQNRRTGYGTMLGIAVIGGYGYGYFIHTILLISSITYTGIRIPLPYFCFIRCCSCNFRYFMVS